MCKTVINSFHVNCSVSNVFIPLKAFKEYCHATTKNFNVFVFFITFLCNRLTFEVGGKSTDRLQNLFTSENLTSRHNIQLPESIFCRTTFCSSCSLTSFDAHLCQFACERNYIFAYRSLQISSRLVGVWLCLARDSQPNL